MKTVTIKTNVETRSIQCPESYKEITTLQWQRIIAEWIRGDTEDLESKDCLPLFAILTGLKLSKYEGDSEGVEGMAEAIGWFFTEDFKFDNKLPESIVVDGRKIDVPQRPRALSIGQHIHLRRAIAEKEFLEESIAIAAAVSLQPIIDAQLYNELKLELLAIEKTMMPGNVELTKRHAEVCAEIDKILDPKFKDVRPNKMRAIELSKKLEQMPAYQIRPIGFFSQMQAASFGQTPKRGWRKLRDNLLRRLGEMSRRLLVWRRSSRTMTSTTLDDMRKDLDSTLMTSRVRQALEQL